MASAMTPLSTAQAAAIARVNPATVCRWCDGGGLRHTTTALGHRVIAQSDLEAFLAARRQRQAYIYVKQEAARMGQTVDKFLELNLKPEAAKD